MPNWVTSVGMEVHVELNTRSKMFCRCPVDFGGAANTRVCPVCLGLPGALPVPNRVAIEKVLRTALALNCEIAYHSIFHRKNYFYPDLPKGYQISQYGETNPLGYSGFLEIPAKDGSTKRIRIRRVHLEEDTGKLIHLPGKPLPLGAQREAAPPRSGGQGVGDGGSGSPLPRQASGIDEGGVGGGRSGSGVDYNRSGVPLMEIVTDFPPDIEDPDEAKEYLVQLRAILLYLDVSDCKMEEGSMRCEPNISIRPEGSDNYGTKTEIKNLNSFRSVQLGVEHEAKRQATLLEAGKRVLQETRGWHEGRLATFSQRVKEVENDYRYFPDPDLVPMDFEHGYIDQLRKELPELPLAKSRRYQQTLGLSAYDAGLLVADRDWAGYFEEAIALGGEPKVVCNWMNSELAMYLNADGIAARASRATPAHLADLTKLVSSGQISGKIGKDVFRDAYASGRMPSDIVEAKGLVQVSDASAIEPLCRKAIGERPDLTEKFRSGQQNVIGFLVGQVMKESQGKANPQIVQETLRRLMEEQ